MDLEKLFNRKYIWFIDIDTRKKHYVRRKKEIAYNPNYSRYIYSDNSCYLVLNPENYGTYWGLVDRKPNIIIRSKKVLN